MKKILSWLLVFAVILTYMPFYSIETFADTTQYDHTDYSELQVKKYINDELSNSISSSQTIKGFELLLNVELHKEKSILVYGTYEDVLKLEGKNDFKIVDKGYYSNGSYRGEYRSHGYTGTGGLYYSNDFPRDSDSGRTVSEKEWIYKFWTLIDETPSKLTKDATNDKSPLYDEVRIRIDDMVNDVLKNSTNDSAPKDHENQGYAVADHMNVNTLNSTLFNGEGKMMQENAGRLWYQMFSTEKANGKEFKGQDITVEILEKGSYQVNQSGQSVIKVKVVGSYQDAGILTDADKVIYYHEDEIKGINLSLSIGSKTLNYASRPNTSVDGHSALEHTFEMTVDEGDITEGIITAKGMSYTEFYTPGGTAINTEVTAVDGDSIGGGLKSLFDVKDIQLMPDPSDPSKTLPFTESMIEYTDYSIGEIDKYEITVANLSSNRKETFTYAGNPSAFTHDLYEWLIVDDEYSAYEVLQVVSNAHAEDDYIDHFSFRREVKKAIELELDIPHHVIDIDEIEARDNTNYGGLNVKSKSLKIDGKDVEWDRFFSGNYFFGPTNSNYLAIIEIKVVSEDGIESIYKDAFNVHSSLPRTKLIAEGSMKENRKVSLYNRSLDVEDPFVTGKYPNVYSISYSAVDGSMENWKMKPVNDNHVDMLFKESGFYKATITATNGSGRTSSTDYHIGIVPDFEPNVYFNIWNNVLTRNETLDITYSADSLDGDSITSNNFKIYFDEDEDGEAEKLVFETTDKTLPFTPTQLGFYKIVNSLEESFGEETIEAFITDADTKKKMVERVFYVDNLRPLVEIDLDIPENFQKVDMYIMSDENLNDLDIKKLREGRIDYNNDLRLYGLDVKAEYRDLKTYIQSQAIDTSYYYGGSYPPSARAYSSSGFTGTLARYNVTNNSYEDYYTTSESYESCSTTNVFNGYVNCDSGCMSSCRFAMGNNCEGGCCDKDYTQKESCTTKTTTVRHYYTVNRYTGYYRGTATKAIKQPYTNPFRETSDKYVIYVSDASFNLNDFNEMKLKADFEVILIGNEALRDSVGDEILFIENDGSDMDELIKKAIDVIGARYPFSSKYLIQVNDSFTLNQIMFDTEGDPLTNYGYQYVQEEVYDNSTGMETYARASYLADSSGFSSYQATAFNKVGLFKIFALLKDSTGQLNFDKDSNVSDVSVLVHRKPMADYVLDWTYDTKDSMYEVTFVDRSYDLDHQFSDAQRGIRDFKAMYKLQGASSWIYAIPSSLAKGTYEFRYSVKDMEGAWSDPKTTLFTLSEIPPPQLLSASLKTTDDDFSLNAIPATEFLTLYDVKTRFPYDVELSYGWFKNGVIVQPFKEINTQFDDLNGDRIWDAYDFEVPKTLSDGPYTIELKVEDKSNSSNYVSKLFDIEVLTPIELNSSTPEMILPGDNRFSCTTSRYVDSVDMTLYHNTSYAESVTMNRVDESSWEYIYSSSDLVPDGFYDVYYEASVHSTPHKTETQTDQTEKVSLRAESIVITGAWQYWDGGLNIFGEQLTDEAHRFLSLEEIEIRVETIGKPDRIEIDMSDALKAMAYRDHQSNLYLYEELVGFEESFPLMMTSSDKDNWHRHYILPLAPSTKTFENEVLLSPYYIKITLIKGTSSVEYYVNDIHITGNTLDHLYLQPNE
ncbi:MAG: hypothetical protein JEZ08_18090 [Clostridiales bacterium]|nr:hypothetical protein [Clostridiales bacterium]